MSDELKRAADLIRERKNVEAWNLLIQIVKANPKNDEAWVYLASVAPDLEKRQKCLEEALKHNPGNQMSVTKIS